MHSRERSGNKNSGRGISDERLGQNNGDDWPFVHYTCASLAHFIALLCRPVTKSLPANTAVVVVDSLSALLNETFPKAPDGRKGFKSGKGMRLIPCSLSYLLCPLHQLQSSPSHEHLESPELRRELGYAVVGLVSLV